MKYLSSLFLLFLTINLNAQRGARFVPTEFGFTGGAAYYLGDINPVRQYYKPKFSGGVHFKKNINRRISWRLGFVYARLAGADADFNNEFQQARNLSFTNNLYEVNGLIEINFHEYQMGDMKQYTWTPYIFIGGAYFKQNPRSTYNNDKIDLQALGTEGQGSSLNDKKNYNLNQFAIPFGIGTKFNISRKMSIAFEYGMRKTFTDYLDDISNTYVDPSLLLAQNGQASAELADNSTIDDGSNTVRSGQQRGNKYTKDWYSYSGITLSFALGRIGVCEGTFMEKKY